MQVMVEGPGHIPMRPDRDERATQQEVCHEAPFYVLGPLVTDIAPGYDHITTAIGAALAGWHGASMLCYVTPKEHLGLPNDDDVRQGVIAYKIAAHAGRHRPRQQARRATATASSPKARFAFDWKRAVRALARPRDRAGDARRDAADDVFKSAEFCSMCGPKFCSMHNFKDVDWDEIREVVATRKADRAAA